LSQVAAESLLGEVEEKRKKTIQMLEAEYSAKKDEVAKRAEEQKSYIQNSSKKEAAALVQREKIRIGGAAKLQSKKIVFDATEKMLENNVAALKQVLADFANSKDYPEMLAKLVKYASKRLGGAITVRSRPADAALLKKLGVKVTASDLDTIGGVKATNSDGTLELDLTFEELLRNREDEARAFILGKE
jgi:V/A-type H+/Na+-transporting ATPase subunit E